MTPSSSTPIGGAWTTPASPWSCSAGKAAHPKVGVVKCWRRFPPTETWARGRGEERCGAIAISGTTGRYRTARQAETKKFAFWGFLEVRSLATIVHSPVPGGVGCSRGRPCGETEERRSMQYPLLVLLVGWLIVQVLLVGG